MTADWAPIAGLALGAVLAVAFYALGAWDRKGRP